MFDLIDKVLPMVVIGFSVSSFLWVIERERKRLRVHRNTMNIVFDSMNYWAIHPFWAEHMTGQLGNPADRDKVDWQKEGF